MYAGAVLYRAMKLGIALLLAISAISEASLEFKSRVQEVNVDANSNIVEVLFPFENTGDNRVIITEYDAPCACMSAVLKGGRKLKEGRVGFLPNESGVIKGKFELGNLKGSVTKKIVISTRDESGVTDSISLESTFHIPFLIAVFPSALSWRVGDSLEAKEISLLVDHDEPIEIVKVSSSTEQVEFELETVKPGFEYKLMVKPKSTQEFLFAAIRIKTNSDNPRYQALSTFITVKPQKKQQ